MDYVDRDLAIAIENSLQSIVRCPILTVPHKTFVSNGKIVRVTETNISIRKNEMAIPCKKFSNLAAVILFPDDNDPVFSSHDDDLQQRMDYMAREYHVYLKRVSSLSEAISVVRTIKTKFRIGHLELGGHGSPTTIAWPKQIIEVGWNRSELETLFNMLEPEAAILTLSCCNGMTIRGDNILEYLAKIARGHQVIGISCENGKHLSLKVSSARPFKVKYKNGGTDVTVIKQFL